VSVLFTIGFVGKKARDFFELLAQNDVRTLIDVRLKNASQLAGYTKKDDLEYFLEKICGIHYTHAICLAPTASILSDYKKKIITWAEYEKKYTQLMQMRNLKKNLGGMDFDRACLLCSEKTPEHCHRRLAAAHLKLLGYVNDIMHL